MTTIAAPDATTTRIAALSAIVLRLLRLAKLRERTEKKTINSKRNAAIPVMRLCRKYIRQSRCIAALSGAGARIAASLFTPPSAPATWRRP